MDKLKELDAELAVIRARLDELANMPEPDGDEAARSKAITDRETETDDLLVRWDELTEARKPLVERAQRLEAVRAAALDMARTEPGDGAQRYLGGQGPAFNKQADPFEGDLLRLGKDEVVTRSRQLIEREKRVHVSDASRARLDDWVQRSPDDDDSDPDFGFDGSYIARRMLLTEQPLYRSAFRKYTAGQDALVMTAGEQAALSAYQRFERYEVRRAISENTTTAGGFGIPVLIDPSIIITSGAADVPLLRACRVENVTNNLWQGVSSAGMTWSYSTEGTEVSDNSPTLAQPSVRVHMPKGFLPYSIEVSQDYPGFASEFGRLIDSGYNDLLATKTMTGTGTNEPFGVFVALSNATSVVIPTTDGSFGGADIFKAWNALPERFRTNAQWVMSVNVQSAIRQFAASQSSTSAYFSIDLTGGQFRINDRPVIITDYAPTGVGGSVPGTTGLQNILAVADWQQSYLWVNRAGMSVEQVPMLWGNSNRFPTGQRGLFAWARNGGNVIVQRAGVLLQNQ
jgi:HK97 family phage major capsid protein